MNYIQTEAGALIDAAQIAGVTEGRLRTGEDGYILTDHRGRELGRVRRWRSYDVDALRLPMAPALPGSVATVMWMELHEGRPSPDNVRGAEELIIAWTITGGGGRPVLMRSPPSGSSIFIADAAGRLFPPGGAIGETFANVEAAKAALMEPHQSRWDVDAAAKAAERRRLAARPDWNDIQDRALFGHSLADVMAAKPRPSGQPLGEQLTAALSRRVADAPEQPIAPDDSDVAPAIGTVARRASASRVPAESA